LRVFLSLLLLGSLGLALYFYVQTFKYKEAYESVRAYHEAYARTKGSVPNVAFKCYAK
jgi:hypothetical protein